MTVSVIAVVILIFFSLLILVSYFSAKGSDEQSFYTGNANSQWYLVAFGMIGSTISGVTFISVPGEVGNSAWTYLQFLLGNFVGYWFIAAVLIPLYYRLNLISIYEYLDKRFGKNSHKIGSFFFIVSQTIGASFRLFLATGVLQIAFFNELGVPFWVTVLITISTIWIYTRKAGIKTVVWTDTLQTAFILASVIATIFVISNQLNLSFPEITTIVADSKLSKVFDWDLNSQQYFFKQFFAGLATVIAINGLDQNMMQKILTCKTKNDAQKNLYWFSLAFIIVNILFLSLGVMLYYYAQCKNISIPIRTDNLFPILVINNFGIFAGIFFLLGILSAAYSSADSALTALTTSFCIDFLNLDIKSSKSKRNRTLVHIAFSIIIFAVIIAFNAVNNDSVVVSVFKAAGYTYGPLLGLFSFGLITKLNPNDKLVPYICVLSPIICYVISTNSENWLNGYKFGFELLILNSLITFCGLYVTSKLKKK